MGRVERISDIEDASPRDESSISDTHTSTDLFQVIIEGIVYHSSAENIVLLLIVLFIGRLVLRRK